MKLLIVESPGKIKTIQMKFGEIQETYVVLKQLKRTVKEVFRLNFFTVAMISISYVTKTAYVFGSGKMLNQISIWLKGIYILSNPFVSNPFLSNPSISYPFSSNFVLVFLLKP